MIEVILKVVMCLTSNQAECAEFFLWGGSVFGILVQLLPICLVVTKKKHRNGEDCGNLMRATGAA